MNRSTGHGKCGHKLRKRTASAIHVQITKHMTAIHVAHDMFNRGERQIDVRRVVHRKDDACDNLQSQAERQNDAPDPHPVQVLGRGKHDCVIEQTNDRKARVHPLFAA